jgi:hypothetical protein
MKILGLATTAATVTAGLTVATTAPAHAASTDVVINEMMYHAVSDLDGDDYIELTNIGSAAVDISGWSFSKGITFTFPSGASIPAGGFVVVSENAAQYQATYGRTTPYVYTGNLSNSGETVTLVDNVAATVDTVTYSDHDPWPTKTDGTGPSLELIDATLDNNDQLNWAAATNAAGATPGTANSVRRSGLGPRVTGMTPSTTSPAANTPMTVTATISGQTTASLLYRIDFNAEQAVAMTDNGDGTFTGTIPGAAAGHLIRYRVRATNANATTLSPRSDDTAVYRGVVVPDGITSPIPEIQWFMADADYNRMVANPTADITATAAIAYNGVVIDNVEANIKGHASQTTAKVSWKFHTPQGYELDMAQFQDPVDEFDLQSDYEDKSHGRSLLSWDAYELAGVSTHTMFPVRAQRNGNFQGLYNIQDTYDGTWRDQNGYADSEFYEAEGSAFVSSHPVTQRFTKDNPKDNNYAPLSSFLAFVNLTGNAERDNLLGDADLPQMINYAAVTAIIQHVDSSSKNFYLAQDPTTGRWKVLPWDLDHTWDNTCCQVTSNFVTPAEPGDKTSALMAAILAVPQWRDMYFRRVRTLVDQILAPGRSEAVYDAIMGPAAPVAALDYRAWPYPQSANYNNYRQQLFTAIQSRRNVFANDSRVPAAQPVAPDITIDEIQPTATTGNQFVELYNPGGQAIDVSGWKLSGAVSLTIQPGTVILPHGAMTFVSNDPAFRAAYGSTVFVGDRFSGTLPASGNLTLSRPDASVADSVDYGGVGWPIPATGQSLELQNLTGDNNDGANWALSTGSGTPGAPTAGGPVINVPDAPTIGTATGGNASATVRWTPPANDGGSAVTGYQVKVLNSAEAQVGALRAAGAAATSLNVTGLTNGTAYHFQVAATNSAGTGPFSASSNTVTPAVSGPTVPSPPTIGAPTQGAAGGALTAIAHWTLSTSTGGSAITGQQVIALRMSSAADDATVLSTTTSRVLGPKVKQYEFSLPAGNYRFQVVAINAVGTSQPSARSTNIVPR